LQEKGDKMDKAKEALELLRKKIEKQAYQLAAKG
jgi:hypothetical protein